MAAAIALSFLIIPCGNCEIIPTQESKPVNGIGDPERVLMLELWRHDEIQVTAALSLQELAGVRAHWELLATHPAVDPDIYLARLQENDDICLPAILVVRKAGQIKGLFLGRIEHKRLDFRVGYLPVHRPRARVLAGLDRGLIGADDPQIAEAMVESIMRLLNEGIVDFAHLACIDVNAPIRRLAYRIPSKLCRSRMDGVEPRWTLDLPCSYDEFLASRSRNTRSNIRRHEKALLRVHPDVRVSVLRGNGAEVAHAHSDVVQVLRRTYQFKLGLGPLCHPLAHKIWDESCRLGRLIVVLIYVGKQPVAFSYAQIYKSAALYMTPGYDPAYASVHVGEYCLLQLIRTLSAEPGVTSLDYGLGYSQYKESFGTQCAQEGHVRIFAPSPKGAYLNVTRTATASATALLVSAAERLGLKRIIKSMLRSRS